MWKKHISFHRAFFCAARKNSILSWWTRKKSTTKWAIFGAIGVPESLCWIGLGADITDSVKFIFFTWFHLILGKGSKKNGKLSTFLTCNRWQVTNSVGWTFSQNFSSLAFPIWDWQCLENNWTIGSLTHLINEWMNYEAVYHTAPATPGLLKMKRKSFEIGLPNLCFNLIYIAKLYTFTKNIFH